MADTVDDRRPRPLGLETVLEIWGRRKWIALLAFAAMLTAFVSLAVWLPDLYRATVTVLVETQQVSEAFVRPSVTAELDTRIQTIRQEIMSRVRLANLIAQLDLYPELKAKDVPFDEIIDRMRRDISLDLKGADPQMSGRTPTIAFAISYSGRNPDIVARVANTLASLYVDENTNIRAGQASRTAEFLKTQLADVKSQLDAQEVRTREFKLSHIGELPEQVEANIAGLDRLNTQLRLNGENQIRAMDRRDRLEKQLADAASIAPTGPPPPTPHAAELAKLRTELAELRRQFTDEYPDVARVRAEIATLERQAPADGGAAATAPAADLPTRLTRAISEADTELNALKQEELALRRAIGSLEQRVDNVPKRREEYQALARDYEATKERYDSLLKRYEEARLAQNLEQGHKVEQFRILDSAIPPRAPSAPGRLRLVALGVMLAVGLAFAAALAAEKLDTSFHGVDDVRDFVRVPALFSIPRIATAAYRRQRRRRFALTVASAMIGLTLIVAAVRHVATGNEQIVRLVARGHA